MTGLHRRQTLQLLGAGTGAALLAGCSESSDETGGSTDEEAAGDDQQAGDLPPYATVLRETDTSDYFYGAIGFETMDALIEDEDDQGGTEPSDPLLGNPILVAFLCSFGFTRLTQSASAEAFVANNETEDGETLVFVEGVYAFSGQYAFDDLTSDLDTAGYTAERVEAEYAVYSDPDSGEYVGVTDEVFAFASPNDDSDFDPGEAVERTVATAAGEREPKHETDADFESLLRAGETDDITLCLYTSDDEFTPETLTDDQPEDDADGLTYAFDAFAGASGVHQRLSLGGTDGTTRGTAVVDYSTDDRVDRELLESTLGTDADTVSVDETDTMITISGEYTDEIDAE